MKKYYKGWLKSLGAYKQYKANLDNTIIGFDENDLPRAFSWEETPEDYPFWEELYTRIDGFEKLIKRVERVDPEAAKFLKKEAWKLRSFLVNTKLCDTFGYLETPQGYDYWLAISSKLGETT